MKKQVFTFFTLLFLLAGSAVFAQQNQLNPDQIQNPDRVRLTPNQIRSVENASFTDLQGNTFKLSDFRGKVVMIDFWETWCKPCINSMPIVNQLVKAYPKNFVVIAETPGISDTRDQVKEFVSKHDYKFHFAFGGNLAGKLQITGIPYKVFIDPNGKFISVMMGSDGPSLDFKEIQEIIVNHSEVR